MSMSWEEYAEARLQEIRRLRSVIRDLNRDIDRKNDMLFQVIQHSREQALKQFHEWKDADDWLFSNFDITKQELEEIYEGKDSVMVYGGSCRDENEPQAEQTDAEQGKDIGQSMGGM